MNAATVSIADFGDTIVLSNCPTSFKPPFYCRIYCQKVDNEGDGSYRFEGVYQDLKGELLAILRALLINL